MADASEHRAEIKSSSFAPRVMKALWIVCRGSAALAVLVGATVLVGWIGDIDALHALRPSLGTVKANTALCFLLAGLALRSLERPAAPERQRRIGQVLAAIVVLLAMLSLSQDLFGWDLGIDQLLVRGARRSGSIGSSMRMPPLTALNFTLLGSALLLLDVETRRGARPAQWLMLLSGLSSFIVLVGYLYGSDSLFTMQPYASIALTSAATFFVLTMGILASRPERGVVRLIAMKAAAGSLARRLLAALFVVPVALGWVRLKGEQAGLYDTAFGLTLFVSMNVTCFVVLTWVLANRLLRSELQRSQAYDELAEHEGRLAITLDSIGDAVIATDAAGRVTRMNPVAERLTGWTLDAARGLRLRDVFCVEDEATGHPLKGSMDEVLRDGIVGSLAGNTVLVARDGSRVPIADSSAPIRDAAGVVRGVVLVFRDQTTERAAEAALRASEAQFTRLLESGILGIIVFDVHGNILEANQAFLDMVGVTREELLSGQTSSANMTPPVWHQTRDPGRVRRTGAGVSGPWEKEYIRKDGRRVWVLVGAVRLDAPKNIAFVIDITARKRLEEMHARSAELEAQNARIQEASRLKSEFLANMSHELRTPLNAVIGFAQVLFDDVVRLPDSRRKEFAGHILTSGQHLLELINDVLDLAKVEAGKLELHPEPVDVESVAVEVCSVLATAAEKKSIRTQVEVDSSLKGLLLDPGRFKQVLYNYLSNALKFTPEGGRVVIRARPEGNDSFRVEVEDTGIGIAKESLGLLFVEFQQLDAGVAKKYGGTGLGLALTKRLVEAQGGSVGVTSTLGEGSVFHAVLPRRVARVA